MLKRKRLSIHIVFPQSRWEPTFVGSTPQLFNPQRRPQPFFIAQPCNSVRPAGDRSAPVGHADLHGVDDVLPQPDRAARPARGPTAGPGRAQELALVEGQEVGAAHRQPPLQQVRHYAVVSNSHSVSLRLFGKATISCVCCKRIQIRTTSIRRRFWQSGCILSSCVVMVDLRA